MRFHLKIRDRIVELRRVPARDLLPNPKNWRTHPKAQQEAMRGILAEVGYADALLARETDAGLQIIDGHLRAETTPDHEVPVLVLDLDEAASLTAANKRIANMLRQAGKADQADGIDVRKKLLLEPAEVALHEALGKAGRTVRPLLKARRYTDVLRTLAGLKDPVDKFFDDVLVMADDEDIRKNRLALLGKLRAPFLDGADIPRLSAPRR